MAVSQLSTVVQHLRCLLNDGATASPDESLLESFLKQRDEAAFEALVRRHGPMVLGVCRRILGNSHDAEDAFQATFLVLVRKAASIRPRSMVGNWLYGVACRTALDARRSAARRRAKEVAVLPRTQPPADQDRADLRAVLDEELQRLPPKSRAVIVLADLEGKTRKEVALQLGWPEGSVASRLARARARLAKRLARYGLGGSGAAVGTLLSERVASACVPNPLVVSTVKAASLLAAGQAAAGAVPAPVAALVEGALKAMLLNKVLKATLVLLVLVALGTGTGLLLAHAAGTEGQEGKLVPAHRPAIQAKANARDEVKDDLDRVQGTWRVVSSQVGDEKASEDEVKKRKVTVKGNVLTYDYGTGDPKRVGTLKLDPKTKYLDWNVTSPEAGTALALYEIKGDEWKIGFGNDGMVRPRSWAIGKDDVVWLLALKREQPSGKGRKQAEAAKETPLQKEWKRLQGTWKAVAYEHEGKKMEGEAFNKSEIAGYVLTIQEGKWIVRSKKEAGQLELSLKIDPTATPKTMEVTGTVLGETHVGRSIYELDGDTLRICTNFDNAHVLPKGFTAKGSNVMVYKRQAKDDQKALQGTWRVTSTEAECVKSPVEGSYTLTFREGKVHQLHKVTNGADFHYSFKLDPSKSPKTIDLTITQAGSEKDKGEVGKTIRGIYAVEGDDLKLCTDPNERPTAFDTKGQSRDTVLMTLKRDKK